MAVNAVVPVRAAQSGLPSMGGFAGSRVHVLGFGQAEVILTGLSRRPGDEGRYLV